MIPSVARTRSLNFFLWISILAMGIMLGGKLFELLILISAWAADPPTSFSLLPYGPRWPFDPGAFFQPLVLLSIIGTVGTLVSGRKAPRRYKLWLWIPLIAVLMIVVSTVTIFWPIIRALYGASTGSTPLSESEAINLANKWIVYDCGRAALAAIGFISSIKAISTTPRSNGA